MMTMTQKNRMTWCVDEENEVQSDSSRDSHIPGTSSAETVTLPLCESIDSDREIDSDIEQWPTASPTSGSDSGADELM